MFDEPEEQEQPAERPADPAQRAKEKSEEFRMHAELAAVFEGCRKFDAELRPGLDPELALRAADRLALGLGCFSLALGVAEVAAPRAVARWSGVRDDDSTVALLRYLGAREIGHGLSILAQPDRARWLWSRVAGDALDLSVVGADD